MAKTARVDENMLVAVRQALVARYASRLEPVMAKHGEVPVVTGFKDPNFIRVCGVAMTKVTDMSLIGEGLMLLYRAIEQGDKLPWDDIPAK